MSKRWQIGVLSVIALFIVTNFTIYLKVYLDRRGEPLYQVSLSADEMHFPYSNHRPEISFSAGELGLDVNSGPWIEAHSSLKSLQALGYCNEPSESKRNQKKKAIFALIELGGSSFSTLKEEKKKEWEKCVEEAKKEKPKDPKACDWREGDYTHLSRLMLKEIFFNEEDLKPFESEGNRYLVLRGTLHMYGCPTNSIKVQPYISLESRFSVPDQFKRDVDRATKDGSKARPLEAAIAVGHEFLLRLQSFKF